MKQEKIKNDFFHIKLNNDCNSRCNFCADNENERKKANPSYEDIVKIIDRAYNLGYRKLIISGGEPTISKIVLKVVSYAKKKGFFIHFVTNGRMLSIDKFFKALVSLGVDKYQISLFAHTPKLFDSISGVKGAFKQVYRGLLNLKNENSIIQFNIVVTKQNYKYLVELYLLMLAFQPEGIQFAFVNPSGFAYLNKEQVVPEFSEVLPFLKKIVELHDYFDNPSLLRFENFPLCELDESVRKYTSEMFYSKFERNYHSPSKTKDLEKCRNCKMKDICTGYWINYVKIFNLN